MVAYVFNTQASPTFLMVFLLLFIASHAVGQQLWVFISEIFPIKSGLWTDSLCGALPTPSSPY
jgi:hypothetical protein